MLRVEVERERARKRVGEGGERGTKGEKGGKGCMQKKVNRAHDVLYNT